MFGRQYRKFLDAAKRIAWEDFRHEYVGTEHLLLALLDDDGRYVTDMFSRIRPAIDSDGVREVMRRMIQKGPGRKRPRELTPRAQGAVDFAREEAIRLGRAEVGPGELLIGMMLEREGVAAYILESKGLELVSVRRYVEGG